MRAWVLKTDTKLHPLLAFVSVLGGIQTLGLWGCVCGANCGLVPVCSDSNLQLPS